MPKEKGVIVYKVVTKNRESVSQLFIRAWCVSDYSSMMAIAKKHNLIKKYDFDEEIAGEAILCFARKYHADRWRSGLRNILHETKIIKVEGFEKTKANILPFVLEHWQAAFIDGITERFSSRPPGTVAFKRVKVLS